MLPLLSLSKSLKNSLILILYSLHVYLSLAIISSTYLQLDGSSGEVLIGHYGATKITTKVDGAEISGNLVVSGTITGSGGSFLPLAGGTMTGNTTHNDNVKSIYGTSSDGLEIYHDGSNSYIDETGTGSLYIKSAGAIRLQSATGENMIYAQNDSAVNLYFNNVNRVQTTSTGANVTGDLTVTGSITGSGGSFLPLAGGTMTGNTIHNDNVKSIYGTASDGLEIYHNGSNSFVSDTGTGLLVLSTNHLQVYNSSITEIMMSCVENGAVNLYYDNSKKLETTTSGIRTNGSLEISGTNTFTIESNSTAGTFNLASGTRGFNFINNNHTLLSIANTGTITASAGTENLVASFVSTDAISEIRIQDNSKYTRLLSVGQSFKIMPNDGVDLIEFNGGTSSVNITGGLSTTASVAIANAGQLQLGTGNHMQVYHNSANGFINNNTGQLNIQQSAVTQSIVFKVSDANALDTTALTISRNADASFGRDVTIAGDLTVNGTTTTINTQTLAVEDPLIELAKDNSANSVDIGFYGKYNDGTARYLGLFADASDNNNFKLFKGTTVQPTTTVDTGGTGYVYGNLILSQLYIEDFIIHHGDGNTKLGFNTTDNFEVVVGGNVNISADTNRSYLRYQGASMAYTDSTGILFQENISLLDNKKALFGNGDLQIQHNGTNSIIDNLTGTLIINQNVDDGDIQFNCDDGSGGITEYFRLDGSSARTLFSRNTQHIDNSKAIFGSGDDFQIWHDGSNTYLSNEGVGNINIQNTADDKDIIFKSDNGSGGTAEYFSLDGGNVRLNAKVDLRIYDAKKLELGKVKKLTFFEPDLKKFPCLELAYKKTNDTISRASTPNQQPQQPHHHQQQP